MRKKKGTQGNREDQIQNWSDDAPEEEVSSDLAGPLGNQVRIDFDTAYRKKPPVPFDDDRKLMFLQRFAETGQKMLSCKLVGVDYKTLKRAEKNDTEFAEQVALVREAIVESLEVSAHRRAVEGVLEPVYQRGEKVGHVRKYSDSLLMMLLRANAPEKYRENVQLGTSEGASGVLIVPVPAQSGEEWEKQYGGSAALGEGTGPVLDADYKEVPADGD